MKIRSFGYTLVYYFSLEKHIHIIFQKQKARDILNHWRKLQILLDPPSSSQTCNIFCKILGVLVPQLPICVYHSPSNILNILLLTFFNTQETFGSTRIIKRTKFKKLKKKKQTKEKKTEEKKVTYKIMFLIYSFRQISSVNPLIFLIHSKLSFSEAFCFFCMEETTNSQRLSVKGSLQKQLFVEKLFHVSTFS